MARRNSVNTELVASLQAIQAELGNIRLNNERLSAQMLSQQTEIQLLQSGSHQLHQQWQDFQSRQSRPQQQTILIRDPIRINPPQEFQGARKEVSSFLAQCEIVFKSDQEHFLLDENKLNTAISYLRGDVFKWYEAVVRENGPFHEYSKFVDSLKATFGNYTEISPDKAMYDVIKCKQNNTVQSYVTAFQMKASRLPLKTTEHTKMFHFKDGLKKQIRDHINTLRPQPTSLSELMKIATEYDDTIHSSLSNSLSNTSIDTPTLTHAHLPSVSSHQEDVEMTEVRTTNVKSFKKLSNEEKQRRKNASLCIYCGESSCPGSKDVNKCPKLSKNQAGKTRRQKD